MAEWHGGFGAALDDDEVSDDNSGQSQQQNKRDGLIVLLDCREAMYQCDSADRCLLNLGLTTAMKFLKQKALVSDRDLVGIVLFGCNKSSTTDLKHIFVLQPLDLSGADRIKQMMELCDMDNDKLKSEFGGPTDSVSLSDAIWACQNEFSQCKLKLGFRRLFLFTNDDNPHHSDAHKRTQLRAKLQDLQQTDVEVILIPQLPTASGNDYFDGKRFYYDDLLLEEEHNVSGDGFLEEILNCTASKSAARRAQVRMGFNLARGLTISVGVYNLSRRCAIPTAERLHRQTNERIKQTTRKFLADTAEVLMPTDTKKAVVIAGKKVLFENEEVKQMRHLADTGLNLIAFYPIGALKNHYHVKPASFVYPDESIIGGSSKLFTSLLNSCLRKQRFILCAYTARNNSPTQLAALLPQAEKKDESGTQAVPPGFHLIQLPYSEDYRKLTFKPPPSPSEEEISSAKALTQRLAISHWSPENHDNPALHKYYSYLEAIALDEKEPKAVKDTTIITEKQLDRAEKEIKEFKDIFGLESFQSAAKRSLAAGEAGGKKRKVDADIDFEAEARAGSLSKLTVAVLRSAAQKFNVQPAGTKKQDIIDAINSKFGI